jgi:hypothetical protein
MFCNADIWDFDSENSNFKIDFGKLTAKYGKAFIVYLISSYNANLQIPVEFRMSDDKFCKINGNLPIKFFENKIKK